MDWTGKPSKNAETAMTPGWLAIFLSLPSSRSSGAAPDFPVPFFAGAVPYPEPGSSRFSSREIRTAWENSWSLYFRRENVWGAHLPPAPRSCGKGHHFL